MAETGDEAELMELLWKAARKGNVPAMRILLTEMRGEHESAQPEGVLDELTAKRKKASGIR